MNCKKCGVAISPKSAALCLATIKATCEVVHLDSAATENIVNQQWPMCRTCMQEWGADEDDLG